MRGISQPLVAAVAMAAILATGRTTRGENLADAWSIALRVNAGLQSQQDLTLAQGFNLRAAKSSRWPTVRTFTFNSFLTATPGFSSRSFFGSSSTGTGAGGTGTGAAAGSLGAASGIPSTLPILGPGQLDLPVSLTFASIPLYTGGRLLRNIDAADAQIGAQKSEEVRTAMDLRLTVAEAYVGVLRAQKNLEVARSSVEQLTAFARDVGNRREQGLAIRSEDLAAQVSLANARLAEIQTRTALEAAWATYNRYVCRPLTARVDLEELTALPIKADWARMAEEAMREIPIASTENEQEVDELTMKAISSRPELIGLAQQARAYANQAEATRGGVRPQVGFSMAFIWLGNNNMIPQGIGAATFYADWTITDSGATRRRANAIQQQERATLRRRADTAADIALQVRTRWLDLVQARKRVPVAKLAIIQAEENINVITDRYRQQLSTYTEVLDAETRRVQSLNNFYNAVYDESLANFRLHRAVGDL